MDTFLNFIDIGKKQKKRFKNSKPYWNNALTDSWKYMNVCEKNFRKCKNRRIMNMLRQTFLNARHSFDKLLRKTERNYKREFLCKIENVNQNNPKEFWSTIKKLGPKKKDIPLKVTIDGSIETNLETVLSKWKSDFEELYNPHMSNIDQVFESNIKNDKDTLEKDSFNNVNIDLNMPVSRVEIKRAITKCKTKKSSGIDNIPNEVIKNPKVLHALFKLYECCFQNCFVPSMWLKTVIKPIPKNSEKDPYVPLNYRGISLISCVCKIYSSFLNIRLNNYLENNDILVDNQNGFRSNRSCEDHVFVLSSVIKNRLTKNKPTFAAFIDLSKAFDSINRDLLFHKLLVNNINGHFYFAVKALYDRTQSCVNLKTVVTDWFNTYSGVRQGDNLSPTLFNLFMNDLAKELNLLKLGISLDDLHLCCLLYADDIVLISDSEDKLQKMLNHFHNWCFKWQMQINISKSKIVHFRNKRVKSTDFNFTLGDDTVDKVCSYKYLGIIFDEFLTFDECARTLSDASGRALSGIISKFKYFKDIGYHTFTKLYQTGVKPIFEYGSAIWGFNKDKYSQQIQNRAIRYYLGVHKNATSLALQADMGWLNVKYLFGLKTLSLWNRIVNMDCSRLTRKILEYDVKLMNNNWSESLLNILDEFNMEDVILDFKSTDIKSMKARMFDLMHQHWSQNIMFKPKLRYYIQYKQDIETEAYVKSNLTRSKRSLLAQLRLSILPLQIEIGRYYRVPLEQRLCKLCNSNQIEDEFHLLCICNAYNNERIIYYREISRDNINFNQLCPFDKFCFILNSNPITLSNYLDNIWNIRKRLIL